MSDRIKWLGGIGAVCALIFVILTMAFGLGKNDDQNYQIKQSVMGKVTIVDGPGWYLKVFATVWTYPRSFEEYFS